MQEEKRTVDGGDKIQTKAGLRFVEEIVSVRALLRVHFSGPRV